MKSTLHPRTVGVLAVPRQGRTRYWDSTQRGLYVLVTEAGARSYRVRYKLADRRTVDFNIGTVEEVSLGKAREVARKTIEDAKVAKAGGGEDPQAKKIKTRTRSTETFGALAERCLNSLSLRPNTERQWRGMVKKHIVPTFGKARPNEITRKEIRTFIEKLGTKTPVLAARVFEVVRRIFSWAVEHEEIMGSPFVGLRKPAKVQEADDIERDRVLSRAEIHAIFKALNDDRFNLSGFDHYVRLIFETAVRREELLRARWSDVDLTAGFFTVPAVRYKSKRAHAVPLTETAMNAFKSLKGRDAMKAHVADLRDRARQARGEERDALQTEAEAAQDRLQALLASPYIFPGPDARKPRSSPQRAFEELRRRAGFEDWTLHDIRRTTATELSRLGTLPHIREAILGHAPDKLSRTYSTYIPLLDMKKALDLWSSELSDIIATPPSVHQFPHEVTATA